MADVRNFKPRLSSSRLFSKGSKDLDSGVVDDSVFNRMTSSFEEKKFLTDEIQFEYSAPLIYQLDLLKEDIDDIHSHLSESKFTSKKQKFPVVDVTNAFYVTGTTSLEGNTTISGFTDIRGAFKINGTEISDLKKSLDYARALETTGVTNTEFDYLDGVTSNIQTQLNAKEATIGSSNRVNALHVGNGLVSNTEFNYVNGVTSAIQTQLNTKAIKTEISGAFTALSASIATDIGNAGGGTIDSSLTNGSTNAVQNNAVYDGLALKLNLSGGTMTGNIVMSNAVIRPVMVTATSITNFTIDMRRANIFQIKASSGWILRVANASHTGQEITIIGLSAGTIVNGKGKANTFLFANGSSLSVSAGQAYKFISDSNGVWRQIH